ncbi:uncharacterized protein A4U43_C04F22890 [Asparagus officinalis]|uniref:Uncharacterized protein n=1 Tax=Asparagus officinalis TaxID=4686 RepID=A0A5P1F7Y0_ASPOF|nr:uncharacterized protein A4U43_C04F22890 [Asparagus officinalis]
MNVPCLLTSLFEKFEIDLSNEDSMMKEEIIGKATFNRIKMELNQVLVEPPRTFCSCDKFEDWEHYKKWNKLIDSQVAKLTDLECLRENRKTKKLSILSQLSELIIEHNSRKEKAKIECLTNVDIITKVKKQMMKNNKYRETIESKRLLSRDVRENSLEVANKVVQDVEEYEVQIIIRKSKLEENANFPTMTKVKPEAKEKKKSKKKSKKKAKEKKSSKPSLPLLQVDLPRKCKAKVLSFQAQRKSGRY